MAKGTITFGSGAKASDVSDLSRDVLLAVMDAAGVSKVVISSTARDPFNQARVMFGNLEAKGVAAQKKLYAAAGDAVIDVYAAAKKAKHNREEIIALMEKKIIAVGPEKVSKHAADPKVLNVFDVAPSSIPSTKKAAWEDAIKRNKKISRFFFPPDDPGYHFEIPQV
jgi:co-chaperonin GroES (HSP10)